MNSVTTPICANLPGISYNGNQLKNIFDDEEPCNVYGSQYFRDGANLDVEYEFDPNGNMIKDFNKGITKIAYNYLNLPQRLQFQPGHTIKYTYDATGRKVKVTTQTAIPGVNIPMGNITDLDASQIADTQIEDYVNNVIYKNGSLYAVRTPEGYVKPVNGSSSNWEYKYQIKDYLGNVRCEVSQTGNLLGKTNYYPFGMEFGDNALPLQEKERFNRKELEAMHGLNLLDYGARRHDFALGRFMTVDPLAEKYYSVSPYAYCMNNPVRFIDPNGEDVYMFYYVTDNTRNGKPDVDADAMFWASALTKAVDMLKNGTIKDEDVYVFRTMSDLGKLGEMVENDVAAYSPKFGKTAEFSLWSHGGLDGPIGSKETTGSFASGHQMTTEGWGNINFNWKEERAKAMFYGCRTGSSENWTVTLWNQTVSKNSNMQDVAVYGQTTRSWPSIDPNNVISPSINGTYPTYMVGAGQKRGGINGVYRTLGISYPAYRMSKFINGVRWYTE